MINPVRAMYEMEYNQRDLAREIEGIRLANGILGRGNGWFPRFLARLREGWHVLGQLRRIRIEVSFDLNDPTPGRATQ